MEEMRKQMAVFSSISRQPKADTSDHLRVLPSAAKPSADAGSEDGDEGESGEKAAAALTGARRQGSVKRPKDEACRLRIGRALYAEDRKNVCIIFSDVVRFSRIVDGAPVCCCMPPTNARTHACTHARTHPPYPPQPPTPL